MSNDLASISISRVRQKLTGFLVAGVGMLVLKRLSDAERDGDNIYAVIKGTSIVVSDGR